MRALHSRLLALLAGCLLVVGTASAQDVDPWAELAALGTAGAEAWPALAELVAEARASDPNDPRLRQARYGRHHPRRKQALRDWDALGEALDALDLLERAAKRNETLSIVYRGAQMQALHELRKGLRDATPDVWGPPEVSEPWITGRSWSETLAAVDKREMRAYGALRPTLLILNELRRVKLPADPALGDSGYLDALANAGRAQIYAVRGNGAKNLSYTGRAAVSFHDGRLKFWRAAAGELLSGDLVSDGEGGWLVEARRVSHVGIVGFGGEATREVRFHGRYVASADGVLRGSWRVVEVVEDGEGEGREIASGKERLDPKPIKGVASEVPALLGMSPLMAKIVEAALPRAEKGTVPRRLMLTTRNSTNTRALLSGPEIFAEYQRLIASADHEVLVQTFVWEVESQAAARAIDALRTLEGRMPAGSPATVRFLRSNHRFVAGGHGAMRRMREQLEGLELDPQRVDFEVQGYGHTLLDILHSKAMVVDGEHAILTGANFEVCHDEGEPWFDAGFGVSGDVARALRFEFVEAWYKATDAWLPAPEQAYGEGSIPMLLASSKGRGNPFTNSSDDPQAAAFATAIREAKQLIRIQTPNLNDDLIKDALVDAVLAGVRVELILSHTFNEGGENLPSRGGGNAKNVVKLYRRVLEGGGEEAAARLDMRWYAAPDGTVIVGNGPQASHAKYATFDQQVAIVGSGNLDTSSINNSRELNVVIDDAATVRAWDGRLFEPNFARAGRARTAEVDLALGK